jgi:hypothetical protein
MAFFRPVHGFCHGFASRSRAALRLALCLGPADIHRFESLQNVAQARLSFTSREPFLAKPFRERFFI